MTAARPAATAWIYGALAVLTMLDAFVEQPLLTNATIGLIILFLVLEFRNIPRSQQAAGIVLLAIGLAAGGMSGEVLETFRDGVERSRIFLVLFFALAWLQPPVAVSPALLATRTTIVSQPPGRRYLYLSFGVHLLGAVLNIAGLSLVTSVVDDQKDPRQRRRLSLSLIHGFTAASCWSPFYIGMVVVLVAVPSLTWGDVAPYGAAMAVGLILTAFTFDRLVLRRGVTSDGAPRPVPLSAANLWRTLALLIFLLGVVMLFVEIFRVTVPVALGFIGPPFGLIWLWLIRRARAPGASGNLVANVLETLPTYRNETLVFVAANILGVGIAAAVPSESVGGAVNAVLPWADAKIAALILTFLVLGLLGIHPVIVVLSLSVILPAEVLGVSDLVLGLTYLGIWGMATMLSPFSGTTLFMSRVAKVPPHVIGWRWAPASAFTTGAALFVMIVVIRHMTGG